MGDNESLLWRVCGSIRMRRPLSGAEWNGLWRGVTWPGALIEQDGLDDRAVHLWFTVRAQDEGTAIVEGADDVNRIIEAAGLPLDRMTFGAVVADATDAARLHLARACDAALAQMAAGGGTSRSRPSRGR